MGYLWICPRMVFSVVAFKIWGRDRDINQWFGDLELLMDIQIKTLDTERPISQIYIPYPL